MTRAMSPPAVRPASSDGPPEGTDRGYDWLLRLDPEIARAYEALHGSTRVADLGRMIVVGLALYNTFLLTAVLLQPDIVWMNVISRLGVVTPTCVLLYVAIRSVGPVAREWLATVGLIFAYLTPLSFFWLSNAPDSQLSFGELSITAVFATFLIAPPFRETLVFIAVIFLATIPVILTKSGLSPKVELAFCIQTALSCLFCLYGNYRQQLFRCRDFVGAYRSAERADRAERSGRELSKLSLTDPLTGVPNRRAFDLTLDSWLARGANLTLLMIDIDYFKRYNDTLGHLEGDQCLCKVAARLHTVATGRGGYLARIGGEEFAVLLRDIDPTGGKAIAGHLLEAIRHLRLAHPGLPGDQQIVTISVGRSQPTLGRTLTRGRLMAEADRALYAAKSAGRNRSAVADRSKSRPAPL